MRLDQALRHAWETGCRIGRDGRFYARDPHVTYAEKALWDTTWECEDGWQPEPHADQLDALRARVEALESLLVRVKCDWLTEFDGMLEDPDALEDFNDLNAAIETALSHLRGPRTDSSRAAEQAREETVEQIAAWLDARNADLLACAAEARKIRRYEACERYETEACEVRFLARTLREGTWRKPSPGGTDGQ